jgi:CubicO group peptidase (beta-lactamase class C family)
LRQLLTMTGGLPLGTITGGFDFVTTRDWVAAILANPEQPPGQAFNYSNGSSHLLSAIVATATKRSTLQYAREKLFGPLGIDTEPAAELPARAESIPAYNKAAFAWPKDPQGYHLGFSYLKLTAPDMAKLGQLWLDRGRWQGRRLVSEAWVDESTRPHVPTRGAVSLGDYGYQWWVTKVNGHPAYAALGYGGQLIEVVPHLGLVVAVSSAAEEIGNADASELVSEVIVPALT